MACNTVPIFCDVPRSSGITTGTSANTALDGTGTVATVFTAGADGSKVDELRFCHLGSNVATVVRVFINNGQTNATAANNTLIYETTMAANTLSQVAASVFQVVSFANLVLPAGYKINVTIGTAIAAGIMVTAQGGDF